MRELRLLAAHAPPYNRRSQVPAPVVVGGAHRRGVPAIFRGAARNQAQRCGPRYDHAVGPFRSRADAVDTAALLARFTGVRTCTTRLARSALHGPVCPERELSPCPAARDITAAEYAAAPRRADRADRRSGQCRAGGRAGAQVAELAERAVYEKRGAVAGPRRGRRRGAVARSAPARADALQRTRGGAPRRQRRLAPRGDPARATGRGGYRPPRCSADAGRRRHFRWRPRWSCRDSAPLGGALVEETALDRALAGRARGAHRATARATPGVGWASPVGSAGAWASWAATARSARLAAEQACWPR